MPIRWRLTLWFTLILCVILILSAVVIHVLLQRYLSNDLDDHLKAHSATLHVSLGPEENSGPLDCYMIHSTLSPIDEFAFPGIYVQLVDRNGNVVAKSANLSDQELPVDPSLMERGFRGEVAVKTIAAGGGANVRIMVSPLYFQDQTLLLEVAQSSTHIDETMSQVRWILLAGIMAALTLAAISGAILVRRALSPVKRITATAGRIQASFDLSRRVGYSGPMDEIGELAVTFDQMIGHLDKVFKSQQHFVADASHELRSPLTVLQGNLDLLNRNLGEEDRQESVRVMGNEMGRMVRIVNGLLLLAEVDSGQIEPQEVVSLREILLESAKWAEQLAGSRNIVVGRQEDLYVTGDAHRLRQLLGNLIDNSIKYTPEGGTITLSLFRDGVWAHLEVADTGVGIAPEHLPNVFDRFYRVDKARSRDTGGSGLGLSIVQGIAEKHGGRVTVTSELGKGSTFTAWLRL